VPLHLVVQPREHDRIAHASLGLRVQQSANSCVRAPGRVGGMLDREQDGAAVELEEPCGAGPQAMHGQHARKRLGGVVGVVAVPQGVPLMIPDDRLQRVVLQQERAAWREPGRSFRQRRMLVGSVHHAEAIDDHIGALIVRHRLEASVGGEPEPGAAVRAAVLGDRGSLGQHPRSLDSSDRIACLRDQRGRLCPARLGRHGWVRRQLRESARGAEPHLQRMNRVRARVGTIGEKVARRLIAQVKDDCTGLAAARPARYVIHSSVFPWCRRLSPLPAITTAQSNNQLASWKTGDGSVVCMPFV